MIRSDHLRRLSRFNTHLVQLKQTNKWCSRGHEIKYPGRLNYFAKLTLPLVPNFTPACRPRVRRRMNQTRFSEEHMRILRAAEEVPQAEVASTVSVK